MRMASRMSSLQGLRGCVCMSHRLSSGSVGACGYVHGPLGGSADCPWAAASAPRTACLHRWCSTAGQYGEVCRGNARVAGSSGGRLRTRSLTCDQILEVVFAVGFADDCPPQPLRLHLSHNKVTSPAAQRLLVDAQSSSRSWPGGCTTSIVVCEYFLVRRILFMYFGQRKLMTRSNHPMND